MAIKIDTAAWTEMGRSLQKLAGIDYAAIRKRLLGDIRLK